MENWIDSLEQYPKPVEKTGATRLAQLAAFLQFALFDLLHLISRTLSHTTISEKFALQMALLLFMAMALQIAFFYTLQHRRDPWVRGVLWSFSFIFLAKLLWMSRTESIESGIPQSILMMAVMVGFVITVAKLSAAISLKISYRRQPVTIVSYMLAVAASFFAATFGMAFVDGHPIQSILTWLGCAFFGFVYFRIARRYFTAQTLRRIAQRAAGTPPPGPQLKVGDSLPRFLAKDIQGREISPRSLKGKKIWLIFYRYAGCPLCKFHLKSIIDRSTELKERGIEVIIVSESFKENLPKIYRNLPFTLISDPLNSLSRIFGTRKMFWALIHPKVLWVFLRAHLSGNWQGRVDGSFSQIPAHFIIEADGRIKRSYYGETAADHIPWAWVLE